LGNLYGEAMLIGVGHGQADSYKGQKLIIS
jgi:hypothetical protein